MLDRVDVSALAHASGPVGMNQHQGPVAGYPVVRLSPAMRYRYHLDARVFIDRASVVRVGVRPSLGLQPARSVLDAAAQALEGPRPRSAPPVSVLTARSVEPTLLPAKDDLRRSFAKKLRQKRCCVETAPID